jgi:hypothetical protein
LSFVNQHYISKCLTKPWENGNKELIFFNFSTNKIEKEKSDVLFAKPNLWPKHFEKRFSTLFERMVDHIRSVATSGGGDVQISGLHWRATYALLAVHLMRGMHVLGNHQENEFSILENKKFFQVLSLFSKQFQAVRIPCPYQYLAFPESTIYPLPVKVESKWQVGYAVSISPTCAIAYVPYGWSREDMKKVSQLFLSGLSVGLGAFARRVVLCPDLVMTKSEDFLASKIIESRSNAENLIRMVVNKDFSEQARWEIALNIIWQTSNEGRSLRT